MNHSTKTKEKGEATAAGVRNENENAKF